MHERILVATLLAAELETEYFTMTLTKNFFNHCTFQTYMYMYVLPQYEDFNFLLSGFLLPSCRLFYNDSDM